MCVYIYTLPHEPEQIKLYRTKSNRCSLASLATPDPPHKPDRTQSAFKIAFRENLASRANGTHWRVGFRC